MQKIFRKALYYIQKLLYCTKLKVEFSERNNSTTYRKLSLWTNSKFVCKRNGEQMAHTNMASVTPSCSNKNRLVPSLKHLKLYPSLCSWVALQTLPARLDQSLSRSY